MDHGRYRRDARGGWARPGQCPRALFRVCRRGVPRQRRRPPVRRLQCRECRLSAEPMRRGGRDRGDGRGGRPPHCRGAGAGRRAGALPALRRLPTAPGRVCRSGGSGASVRSCRGAEDGHARRAAAPGLHGGDLPPAVSSSPGGAGRAAVYVRLSLFYTTFLGMGGITLPFWPTWLQSRGLDSAAIGLLLSVPMWVRVASTPLLARLADRRAAAKPILVLTLVAALACFCLFAISHGFWALLAVTFFANSLYGSVLPLGESISLSACRDHRLDYGRARLWGSISFILVAVAAGQLLAGRSPDWILWLTLLGFALTIAAALALPGRRAAAPPSSAGLLSLIGNRRFCLAVVASGLIQASHALLYGFGTIRWLAAGYDKATIGWLWGEGVVVEI